MGGFAHEARAFFEPRFAYDFSRVRVHADARAAQSAAKPPRASNLRVSSPGESAELEAERVATEVMRMPAPSAASELQRKCACEDEGVQRDAATSGAVQAPPLVNEVLGSPGQPLPGASRNFFESRMGVDFSRVRIHTDAQAARSADAMQARAYTVGSHRLRGRPFANWTRRPSVAGARTRSRPPAGGRPRTERPISNALELGERSGSPSVGPGQGVGGSSGGSHLSGSR